MRPRRMLISTPESRLILRTRTAYKKKAHERGVHGPFGFTGYRNYDLRAAWAAASLASGTRKGEQLT